jgi:uncharacterized membrane protein YphA (DoxX/SURF4 family)
MNSKEKIILGISILLALFLAGFSGLGKLMGGEEVVKMFTDGGINDWRTIIGIGEIISAILFAVPATQRFGTWLLSAYFGGAIMFHMTTGESILVPTAFLCIIWVLSILRKDIPVKM